MVKVNINGEMVVVIVDNINMIKNMDMGFILGLMVGNMLGIGLIVRDMDMAKLYRLMEELKKAFGKKIEDLSGFKIII